MSGTKRLDLPNEGLVWQMAFDYFGAAKLEQIVTGLLEDCPASPKRRLTESLLKAWTGEGVLRVLENALTATGLMPPIKETRENPW